MISGTCGQEVGVHYNAGEICAMRLGLLAWWKRTRDQTGEMTKR